MDVRVYSKLEIEFLHVLNFRELMQWTHWPRPADSKPPEHDGNSKKKTCISKSSVTKSTTSDYVSDQKHVVKFINNFVT